MPCWQQNQSIFNNIGGEGESVASTPRTSGRQCCHGKGQKKGGNGEATSQGSKLFTSVCIGVCVLVCVCIRVSVLFYSYTLRPTTCTMCAVAFIRRVLRLAQGLLLSCSSNSIFMSMEGAGRIKLRHLMMLLSKLKQLNTNIIETIFSL